MFSKDEILNETISYRFDSFCQAFKKPSYMPVQETLHLPNPHPQSQLYSELFCLL